MKGGGGGVAPAKRRWRGLAIGVLFLVVLSMLVPLGFLLGLHNGFYSAGASVDLFLIRASASASAALIFIRSSRSLRSRFHSIFSLCFFYFFAPCPTLHFYFNARLFISNSNQISDSTRSSMLFYRK